MHRNSVLFQIESAPELEDCFVLRIGSRPGLAAPNPWPLADLARVVEAWWVLGE